MTISENELSWYHTKMAVLQELKRASKIGEKNVQLAEHLANSLWWVIRYCASQNIPIADKDLDIIHDLVNESLRIVKGESCHEEQE